MEAEEPISKEQKMVVFNSIVFSGLSLLLVILLAKIVAEVVLAFWWTQCY